MKWRFVVCWLFQACRSCSELAQRHFIKIPYHELTALEYVWCMLTDRNMLWLPLRATAESRRKNMCCHAICRINPTESTIIDHCTSLYCCGLLCKNLRSLSIIFYHYLSFMKCYFVFFVYEKPTGLWIILCHHFIVYDQFILVHRCS